MYILVVQGSRTLGLKEADWDVHTLVQPAPALVQGQP